MCNDLFINLAHSKADLKQSVMCYVYIYIYINKVT